MLTQFAVIDVGDYGRSSDSGIFKESLFGKKLINYKLNLPAPKKIPEHLGYYVVYPYNYRW